VKRLRNVSPLGAVVIPTLGVEVEAGGEFDCPDEVATSLLEQAGNYEPVGADGKVAD
jgi:hypothetical protein